VNGVIHGDSAKRHVITTLLTRGCIVPNSEVAEQGRLMVNLRDKISDDYYVYLFSRKGGDECYNTDMILCSFQDKVGYFSKTIHHLICQFQQNKSTGKNVLIAELCIPFRTSAVRVLCLNLFRLI
jgi:hypothetical protein